MSGSNKLVRITLAFYKSYVSPGKKKSYGGTILFSPLIICLQINLPNVKTCGMPSGLIKRLKVTWMMG
jgi:hypothetical protein